MSNLNTASAEMQTRKWMATIFLAVFLLAVFGFFAFTIQTRGSSAIDEPVILMMRSQVSPFLTETFKLVTFWGSAPAIIGLAVTITVILRRRELHPAYSSLPAAAVAGGWLINVGLKNCFHRLRPDSLPLVTESGFSFPSAHAMVSICLYGAIAFLVWKYAASRRTRWFVTLGLGLLTLSIGISRIYLGVHYPSDVTAGFAAGGLWLILCIAGADFIESGGCSPRFSPPD